MPRNGRTRVTFIYRCVAITLILVYALILKIIPASTSPEESSSSTLDGHAVVKHLAGFQVGRSSSSKTLRRPPLRSPPQKVEGLPDATLHTLVGEPHQSVSMYGGASGRRKLQEKLDDYFVATGKQYQDDLWELSDSVPPWMKGRSMDDERFSLQQ